MFSRKSKVHIIGTRHYALRNCHKVTQQNNPWNGCDHSSRELVFLLEATLLRFSGWPSNVSSVTNAGLSLTPNCSRRQIVKDIFQNSVCQNQKLSITLLLVVLPVNVVNFVNFELKWSSVVNTRIYLFSIYNRICVTRLTNTSMGFGST